MNAVHPSRIFTIDTQGALVLTMPDPVHAPSQLLEDDAFLHECASQIVRWVDTVPRASVEVRFDHVEVAPSHLFGWLITLKRAVTERGARFRLSGLQPRVREVVAVLKLDRFLNVPPPTPA
jgi:anti-anti-sigma regulatory factor